MDKIFGEYGSYPFPSQRVSNAEKEKPEWYANCCDWIIAAGLSCKDEKTLNQKYAILSGKIPDEFYRKTLNPYNATNEKYQRFPATLRNYDMCTGIIRRYVSEYIKNPHDFIVGAANVDVILARNAKLQAELMQLAQMEIAKRIQESYKEWLAGGNDPQEYNPEDQINFQEVIDNFKENYVDEISAQGQELLNVIDDLTESMLLYAKAYFDWVAYGECFTYTEIKGDTISKRAIDPRDAYPVPNSSMFVEDHDMFAERMRMTYQQIVDNFDEYLSEKDKDFLARHYGTRGAESAATFMSWEEYYGMYPDVCDRCGAKDRTLFEKKWVYEKDANAALYDVWHVVWRGEIRRGVLTYVDASTGMLTQRIVEDGYQVNPLIGDISIEYIYEPQTYECVRIGGRHEAIYPYKARTTSYNRKGKLPYNGIIELLPGFGKFSIVEILTPYQIFKNIICFHREMAVAKNKLSVLLIAKSLLGKVPDETIYRMAADGVLYIDDEEDDGMLKSQQIRMLNASIGDYIKQLSDLIAEIDAAAKDQVDMTQQRYGEIANSAGKAVTEEAILRGSMGSVIVEFIFDAMRERDYGRDLDLTKLAWIDGLETSYKDRDGNLKYISLNVDNHVYADYIVKAKNSTKEKEKLDQIKQFAFSAAQNGNMDMAIAAITADNVSSVKKLIMKYQDIQNQHEEQLKQMDQQLEQMKSENELKKISHQAEEDRKTVELEKLLDQQIALIKADANMVSFDNGIDEQTKQAGVERLEQMRNSVEREKIQLEREKVRIDSANKAADRAVKMHDIDTKLKIAKENKNKYDVKSKK